MSLADEAALSIAIGRTPHEKRLASLTIGQCTNVLGSTGASEKREAHIGWQSTVQRRHYAGLKHTALNARTPHLLAGRSGRGEPPHHKWQCPAQAPGGATITGSAFGRSPPLPATCPAFTTRSSRSWSLRATPNDKNRRPTCSSPRAARQETVTMRQNKRRRRRRRAQRAGHRAQAPVLRSRLAH
jgi:hypothetical protein